MDKLQLKSYKEKQFLVFEFEDGKNVKYNLATGECIGKSGRVVKDVCTQLRGYELLEVIDSFEDEKYRNFLKFVDKQVNTSTRRYHWKSRVDKITNIGTFLKKIKDYSKYEQIFSSGIKRVSDSLDYSMKDIPKGVIKLCKEEDFLLENKLIKSYKKDPNLFMNILNFEAVSISQYSLKNLAYSLEYREQANERYAYKLLSSHKDFYRLVDNYNYKPLQLIQYIDNLITYEALQNFENTVTELYDYARMMFAISNKIDKYPKNFLTTHRIASRNYTRLIKEFKEELFAKRIDENFECVIGDYVFIYPKTVQEVKDEAVQQNNCVASYIQRVIDGECHIIFMRKKDEPNKSVVTVEVRNFKVVQARRRYNADITTEEKDIIEKYNKKLERVKKQYDKARG